MYSRAAAGRREGGIRSIALGWREATGRSGCVSLYGFDPVLWRTISPRQLNFLKVFAKLACHGIGLNGRSEEPRPRTQDRRLTNSASTVTCLQHRMVLASSAARNSMTRLQLLQGELQVFTYAHARGLLFVCDKVEPSHGDGVYSKGR